MIKDKSAPAEADLIGLFDGVGDDPHNFDTLLAQWNIVFERGPDSGADKFAKVESAAIASAAAISTDVPVSSVGRQVGHLLEQFGSPAFLSARMVAFWRRTQRLFRHLMWASMIR